ncbi:serine/threonine-protein kinase [Actinoplanes sp. NPDC023936]|uniref:serine/threonine-protein kinase n=1 Tax=Actinoplanes sp. NPDC023936 TaxID=3154910 RepID=UPI0033D7E7AC
MDLQPGARLGDRYHLRQRLGAGGMGEVWLAVDEVLRRTVAVKAMLPEVARDPDFARRFAAEATAMARVSHPAVASIHDYGSSHGVAYLVMEFVDGESLSQRLAREVRLAPDVTMRLVADVASGLQAVHDQGLVHRDIKPANLLVRRDGTVVITDFGIARHEDASLLTASGAILGTPSYLSPEQVRGEPAGPRSDVYALGLVAYECLAGERPFTGDNPYAVALQRLQSSPRTLAVAVPDPVRAVVARALATDQRERWPSAATLAAAARAATTPPAADAAAPAAADPPAVPAAGGVTSGNPRRPALFAALAAVILALGGIAAWSTLGDGGHGTTGNAAAAKDPGASPGAGSDPGSATAGFTACGDVSCPTEPLCWAGTTTIGGEAMPIRSLDCAAAHRWETVQAVPLPPGDIDLDTLIQRPAVAAACSTAVLAERSRDPDATKGWNLHAWPIEMDGVTLVHCLTGSPEGESTGSRVQP